MEASDLKTFEETISRQYDRDGLIETLLGMALLIGGMSLALGGSPALTGLLPVYILVIGRLWKTRITYPRLGYADFLAKRKKQRKIRMLKFLLALVLAAVLAALIFLAMESSLGDLDPLRGWIGILIFDSVMALIIAAVGRIRKMRHLYAFAALCYLLELGAYIVNMSPGWALSFIGLLLLTVGLVRLILFLRANPKLEGEAGGNE
jgi:hypothetical protein